MKISGTTWIVGVVVTTVAVGLAGAVAWVTWADPAQWLVVDGGLSMDEPASRGQFGSVVTFVAVGLVGGLVLGVLAAVTAPRPGWTVVLAVALLSLAASLISWRLGIVIGPPDPTRVSGLAVGDRVPARLEVDTVAAFLAWPIGALTGLLAGVGFSRTDDV